MFWSASIMPLRNRLQKKVFGLYPIQNVKQKSFPKSAQQRDRIVQKNLWVKKLMCFSFL